MSLPFTQFLLTECNCSRPASLKFPFTLILAGTVVALWRHLRNNEWVVLMKTRPLLRDVRHRAMIAPVSSLRNRIIHINPSYWTIYRSFEIILEWKLSIGLEFDSNVPSKFIASKKHSIWYDTVYGSGSQPGCRGTLGCHLQCPGVPRANTFFYHIIKNTFSNCHQTWKQIAMGAVNYYSFL